MIYKTFFSRLIITAVLITASVMITYSQSWQHLGGPLVARDVCDVSAGYQNGTFTIYAADAIKLSKSVDQGSNWTFISGMDSPLLVACSPTNSNTLLVAKGAKVFLSFDGGTNFLSTPRIEHVDPLRLLYSRGAPNDAWVGTKYEANKSSLRRSTNGGVDFEGIRFFEGTGTNPKTNVEDVWTVPNNPNVVWVASSRPAGITTDQGGTSGLWRSTNKGANWSGNLLIHFNPVTGQTKKWIKVITAVTTTPTGDKIYVGTEDGIIARFDSAGHFTVLKNLSKPIKRLRLNSAKLFAASKEGLYVGSIDVSPEKKAEIEGEVLSLEIDPMNENRILVGTSQYVYISTDGGTNFTQTNPRTTFATLNSKAVTAIGNVILAIAERSRNNDVIYRYDGTEWSAVDMSFAKNKFFIGKADKAGNGFYRHSADTIFVFGRIEDRSKDTVLIARSVDTGKTWIRSRINAGTSGAIINGIVRWNNKLYAYGKVGKLGTVTTNILVSTNNGTSWNSFTPVDGGNNMVYTIAAINGQVAFAGMIQDGLWQTTTGGTNWHRGQEFYSGGKRYRYGDIKSIAYSVDKIFAASDNGLFNEGALARTGKYKQVIVHPDNSNKIYTISERRNRNTLDTIWISTNRGVTWTVDTVDNDIRKITIQDNVIYRATDKGIYAKGLPPGKVFVSDSPPVGSGSNPGNIIWESGSTVVINGAPTIPAGSTLTIEPGVRVIMTPGSQIRVQGELNIQGNTDSKVRFTSEDPSQRWGGIYLAKDSRADIEYAEISGAVAGIIGAKAELYLSNSEIKNCLIGVALYGKTDEPSQISSTNFENNAWGIVTLNNSSPVIVNNIIRDGQKGILIEASNPQLLSNTISNNSQVGVVIYGGAYCRFSDISGTGSNTIQGNQITQILAVKGTAFLGYQSGTLLNSFGGDNIIRGDDPDAPLGAILEYSQLVNLKLQPALSKSSAIDTAFLVDETSRIIEDPIDQYPEPQQLLFDAYNDRRSGLYQDAIFKYETIISNYPSSTQASIAVNELRETYQELKRIGAANASEQLIAYLESLWSHTNVEVVRSASLYLAREYAESDEPYTAVEKYQYAIDNLNPQLDPDLKISAYISKMMLEGYEFDNIESAEETFAQMLNQFSDDERTQLAQLQIQLMQAVQEDISVFSKNSQFEVKMRKLPNFRGGSESKRTTPTTFDLQQNYPNPFNPSTLIKYQLPKASKVEIKIYNIYGQEVKKLINEVQDAGYYEIIWNGDNNTGSQVASGVYFYKLAAGSFTSVKKMLLLR